MTLEEFARQQSTPSKAGADKKPKKSHRYVIEVRTAQGQSLVLTTMDWTTDGRRNAINQILRLAGFAKPAVDKPRKGRSAVAKNH